MGISYDEKEEYDKAIESYQKAVNINPRDDEAYNNMGIAYGEKKDYDKAIESYKKAIDINPKNLYKENLDYLENKIKVEEKRISLEKEMESQAKKEEEKLKKEMKSQSDAFNGEDISERIKYEQKELFYIKIKIALLTIIATIIIVAVIIIALSAYSTYSPLNNWSIIQANFTALFVLSPLIWSLKNAYKRKNILELSIHDLKDKHYLISIFFGLDKSNKEKYTNKMLDIMSKDSTAKLLSRLYSLKVENVYPIEVVKNLTSKEQSQKPK